MQTPNSRPLFIDTRKTNSQGKEQLCKEFYPWLICRSTRSTCVEGTETSHGASASLRRVLAESDSTLDFQATQDNGLFLGIRGIWAMILALGLQFGAKVYQ